MLEAQRVPSLYQLYDAYFEVVSGVRPGGPLAKEAHRLRYQVYCLENAYEPPDASPDGLEQDAYDARAVHTVLRHRPTGTVAGTVRLILPDDNRPCGSLPIDQLCAEPRLSDAAALPRATTAEVSRFAISRAFRRRLTDSALPGIDAGVGDTDTRRRIPNLSLGLIQGLVTDSRRRGISHWTAEMERPLLRMLSRLGIDFSPVGPPIEYHGLRQPCFLDVELMLAHVRRTNPEFFELLTAGPRQ